MKYRRPFKIKHTKKPSQKQTAINIPSEPFVVAKLRVQFARQIVAFDRQVFDAQMQFLHLLRHVLDCGQSLHRKRRVRAQAPESTSSAFAMKLWIF